MSASSKFDLSSGSPDRPLYASGHRGSYGSASLDKSGSFRENLENPLLSSLPNMTRSSSSATKADVLNFFQCVRFDPKSMVVEHKLNRPGEFKRLASSAVGIPTVDSLPASSKSKQPSSSSPEDLRRLKSGARESGTKARERVKILNDCLSVINKCFPSIPSKKRSRLDALSNDRSYTVLPIDRPASGMGIGKSGFELELQKSDERTKNVIRNKRPRTSMVDSKMDVRANTTARLSGAVEKDRDVVRPSNGGVVQSEDRGLSIAVDGWEKSKMKKKRTGIKQDAAATSIVTKPVDGYRESKQLMQPRFPTEPRPRLTVSQSFSRSGIANGDSSTGKAEATSQTSSGMRSSVSRTDSENSSMLHERRDRLGGQEKERVNLKASNNTNSREDCLVSGSNLNATVRAPRSGSFGGMPRLSPVQRSTSSNDWEPSNCTSKVPGVLGVNNRKRTSSARSSSPPVTNWVQKPQKISRTPRRTNLLPIVSGDDENPALDMTSNMMVNDRHLPAHSPHEVKIKSDHISPTVSESEESGAAEAKLKDKSKKCDEIDEKGGQNVQKMSNLLLPPRKKVSRDDHGDGVRRQGRTGRRFASSRALLPTVEKLGNVGATKQIRSSRHGLDKTERAGRPPTRKLSDRKAYTRQKHIPMTMTADYRVCSEDGHEELLAAANAATDNAQALSSPFWKEMETLFRHISDKDISYLEDQVNLGPVVDTPGPAPPDADSSTLIPNGYGLNEFGREWSDIELSPELVTPGAKTSNGISLCQRLMASLIPEEGNLDISTAKEHNNDLYESRFEIETDVEADTFCSRMSQSCELSGSPSSNVYGVNTNGKLCYEMDRSTRNTNSVKVPDPGVNLSHDHLQNSIHGDQVIPGTTCSEYEYANMSINERLLLEMKSIGLYPDLGPDLVVHSQDGDINRNISRLDDKYQEQVPRKKNLLGKLLGSVSDAKVLQEKDFEEGALDKLVVMAYEKYMSCWGPNAHGMKSASGKMAKQAALAFVKRALERYQEFEVRGKSCFDEPIYKNMFLSGMSRLIDRQPLNWNTNNESGKLLHSTSGCSAEVRITAPVATKQSPSNNQEMFSSEARVSPNLCYAQDTTSKQDSWSNRVKKRELLLDDVGGGGGAINSSLGEPSGLGGSLSRSAKGKRSERDREGKGNSREVLSRSGTTKISRVSVTVKGDRKSKAKPKQKNANLSASVNGPLGNMPQQPKLRLLPTLKSNGISDKDKNDYNEDTLEEQIDLSNLQIPEMDGLVPDELGGQGEDIGSWLDIEDEVLQDHDFMGGLEIPMDDLADLNMLV